MNIDTSGDFYVTATQLLSKTEDANFNSEINKIETNIPGGLVFDGTPPYYESFANHEIIPLPNWPQTATHLLGITLDGQSGFVNENHNQGESFLIDFKTGNLTSFPSPNPRPSSDGNWIILPGISTNSAVAMNIGTETQVPLCSSYNLPYRWSRDSNKIVAMDGIEQVVYITDFPAMNCTPVKLSGLSEKSEVLVSPEIQKLIIILSGSPQTNMVWWLMTANLNGTGKKKISELPITDRESDSVGLVSPGGTAIYVEGYVVDVKTGHYAPTPHKALAWLKTAPPGQVARNLRVNVDPASGERGTRFRFSMSGGPVGQEVTWYVSRSEDNKGAVESNTIHLDQSGALNDREHQFGYDTGLPNEVGNYYVLVTIGDKIIGNGSFSITEP